MFEFFEHPSDIGIKGAGSSYEEAFIEAAKGMMSIMADLRCFTTEFGVIDNLPTGAQVSS